MPKRKDYFKSDIRNRLNTFLKNMQQITGRDDITLKIYPNNLGHGLIAYQLMIQINRHEYLVGNAEKQSDLAIELNHINNVLELIQTFGR